MPPHCLSYPPAHGATSVDGPDKYKSYTESFQAKPNPLPVQSANPNCVCMHSQITSSIASYPANLGVPILYISLCMSAGLCAFMCVGMHLCMPVCICANLYSCKLPVALAVDRPSAVCWCVFLRGGCGGLFRGAGVVLVRPPFL